MEAELLVMRSELVDGMESGGSRADPQAVRVGHGESDGGGGNAANALGALELPVVELPLLGTGGREHDRIPCRNPSGMPDRQPQMVPGFPQHRGQVSLPLLLPRFGPRESSFSFSRGLHFRLFPRLWENLRGFGWLNQLVGRVSSMRAKKEREQRLAMTQSVDCPKRRVFV